MNRLFHVLVMTSLPGAALGCGQVVSDDAGASGSGGGGSTQGPGGEHSMSAGGQPGGGSSTGGAAPSSGGSLVIDVGTGGGGSPADFVPISELDCASEQWACRFERCRDNQVNGTWELPEQCRCDEERPTSAEDCDEAERFVCGLVEDTLSPSGRVSCTCAAEDLDPSSVCRSSIEIAGRARPVAGSDGDCRCALLVIV